MKKIGLLLVISIFMGACAVFHKVEKETVKISTNAECGMCKERIEGELNFVKGIIFAELDVASKALTVKYKSNQITIDEIRQKIAEIGYNADAVKADVDAQGNLPDCCKPGGMK